MSKVSLVKCEDYSQKNLKKAVFNSLKLINGLKLIKGKTFLKINLITGKTPEKAANTHPEFLRTVIRIVKKTGAEPIVGDSCGVHGFTDEALVSSGIKKITDEENVKLVNFESSKLTKVRNPRNKILKELFIPEDILKANTIISLPKLKTHALTNFTGAVKNMFGIIPGAGKARIHQKAPSNKKMSKALVDIFSFVKPDLSIMDGVLGMEGNGPANGKPIKSKIIASSSDSVALDSVCSYLVGFKPEEVLTNIEASKRGFGEYDLNKIQIFGENINKLKINFKKPITSRFRRLIPDIALTVLFRMREKLVKPAVIKSKCKKCGFCAKVCPVDAIILNPYPEINLKKCILCYCCHENCPYEAMKLKASEAVRARFKRKFPYMKFKDMIIK